MNYLDIIFAVPLIWAIYKGLNKGLIFEVATLVGLILGIWGGIHFSDLVAVHLSGYFESNPEYLPLVSFCVTFGIVIGLILLIGKIVEKVVKAIALSMVNKILGAVFSMLKVGLIMSIILVIVESADQKIGAIPKDLKESSLLYKPILSISLYAIPAVKDSELFDNSSQDKVGEAIAELQ